MRETCARVLAATLMTGAIATVVAMSALFGATGEEPGRLAAPPSSLHRSVPVIARAVASHRTAGAHRNSTLPRPFVVSRAALVARRWQARPNRGLSGAKPKPKPQPAPAPAPAHAPAPTPVPEVPPPTVQAALIVDPAPPAAAPTPDGGRQGNDAEAHGDHGSGPGHAYRHDKHDD